MNRNKIIGFVIVITIIIIVVILNIYKSNPTVDGRIVSDNGTMLEHNNETGIYTVYDESNQIVYNGSSESAAYVYQRHPDYDPQSPVIEDEYTQILKANNEIN